MASRGGSNKGKKSKSKERQPPLQVPPHGKKAKSGQKLTAKEKRERRDWVP